MDATLSEWYARAEKELHQMVTRDKCAAGADPQGRCPESTERAGASVQLNQSSPKRPTEGLTEDGVVKQVIKENVSFIIWSVIAGLIGFILLAAAGLIWSAIHFQKSGS